jgi:hypothetical protein
MILKIFSPKKLAKIFAFFAQTTASFCKNCDHNIGFWEKCHFFRRKLAKIAEKCDHNIVVFLEKRQFFRRKLAKIAENCDHNTDPWIQVSGGNDKCTV